MKYDTKSVMVRLGNDQIEEIDKRAKHLGYDRSQMIRQMLWLALQGQTIKTSKKSETDQILDELESAND